MSDITEYIANLPKPDCAVSVNGNYLEDTVRGYRTSSVTGRNAITIDVTETTIGNSNGSRYRRKRDESRDLTVSFALVGATEADVHMLSRLLQKTLNDPESKFIFADEPTMYWIGTVSGFTEEWQNGAGSDYKAMTGEFTIRCSDPYRHSTTDRTVTTNGLTGANSITLTNDGSSPTPLYIEAYMWEGTRYIAYSLDKDSTTTLSYLMGTLTDVSTSSSSTAPVTVLTASFTSDPSWTKNAGLVPPLSTTCEQTGTIEYKSDGATVTDWGSGSYWHGPTLSHIVPATNGSYPTNWRSTYGLFFDDGQNQANSRGVNAMVYADGSGNPLVTVAFIDQKDDQNTEVLAFINRTQYSLGTLPQNGYHIVNGGNVTVDKVDSDVHIMVSYPKASSINTVQYTSKSTHDDPTDLSIEASFSNFSKLKMKFTGTVEWVSTDLNARTATIRWKGQIDEYLDSLAETVPENSTAMIFDVWCNSTCVCTEHVRSAYFIQASIIHNVWSTNWRYFTVNFDADGNATVNVKMAMRTGSWPVSYTTQSVKFDCGKIEAGQVNAASVENYNIDKHLTMTNPSVTLRQVSWYTGAYGDDYSSSSSSTSGYRRFKNSTLKSFNLIKYNDAKTIAKENSVYFSTGDTITIDADKNEARQNGTKNLNIIDITSEPLMLYPGTHNLKVAVDYKTAQHPPTMRITYKERWK